MLVSSQSVLDEKGYFFSSANSINWGRLAPQIVYYVSAYCDLLNRGAISMGETMDVCVPTGNFGNIFAAYLGKLMADLQVEKKEDLVNCKEPFDKNANFKKSCRAFFTRLF